MTALVYSQPQNSARFNCWFSTNITVRNSPELIFGKPYCHDFFDYDQSVSIGEEAERFFSEIVAAGERIGDFKIYFATAREAFNMVISAIDGKAGTPGEFRDYRLKAIMNCEPRRK